MVKDSIDVRLVYSKTGRGKFISHLDLMRTMTRAFNRGKIPIWHTQGFNPHPYIMFPLALSLGVESQCEIMDIRLTKEMDIDEVISIMNKQLPESLALIKGFYPKDKHTAISFATYEIKIKSELQPKELTEKFNEFLSQEKIEVEKKTKRKGISTLDIKPHVNILNIKSDDDFLIFTLKFPAGTTLNLNTSLLTDEFSKFIDAKFKRIEVKRLAILTANDEDFV